MVDLTYIPGLLERLIRWLGGFGAAESGGAAETVITVEKANEQMIEAIREDEKNGNPCGRNEDDSPKVFLCCVVYLSEIDASPLNSIFDPQERCCRLSPTNSIEFECFLILSYY